MYSATSQPCNTNPRLFLTGSLGLCASHRHPGMEKNIASLPLNLVDGGQGSAGSGLLLFFQTPLPFCRLYSSGRWQYEFDPKQTKEEEFFIEKGKTVKVPMMFQRGLYDMAYDSQLSCTILEIPYRGNITATFVLPDNGKLKLLEQGLQADIFAKWKSLLSKR